MRVAVTGTPGTGKTTATERLTDTERPADGPAVVHLNEEVRERELYEAVDEDRDSVVADLDAVREWFDAPDREWADGGDVVVESHLAHHLPVDRVVVLRCHPDELRRRLRERGASEPKVRENAESEALDLVLAEAVETHGADAVYEVDTTGLSPEEVAAAVDAVVAGDREPSAGTVSFVDAVDVGGEDDLDGDGAGSQDGGGSSEADGGDSNVGPDGDGNAQSRGANGEVADRP